MKRDQFEFCKVCRLNHDQGRRHKYFPNHAKSLSSFLSRFQQKLSDVRFFLKNPSPLRPEHASRNRLWCVFCDSDIDGVGSSFACENAIHHLASVDHLKNLKSFLWKYGGGMDQVNSFRISDEDLAKWEKKCKSLKDESASEGSQRPLIGPSNDIHNELNSECVDIFHKNCSHILKASFANVVMPLQNYTNERYQDSHSELSQVMEGGTLLHDANSFVPVVTKFGTSQGLKALTGDMDWQRSVHNGGKRSTNDYVGNEEMSQVHADEQVINGESNSAGLQNLTQISSSLVREASGGNVHSGAPPPWFDAGEQNLQIVRNGARLRSSDLPPLNKSGKSCKLNPKRVGAAWAEKRKIELEMERRGEIVRNNFDENWLPNFGRVWQSGSRKESRKEFEVENKGSVKPETKSEMINIQPYVSKRMRTDSTT